VRAHVFLFGSRFFGVRPSLLHSFKAVTCKRQLSPLSSPTLRTDLLQHLERRQNSKPTSATGAAYNKSTSSNSPTLTSRPDERKPTHISISFSLIYISSLAAPRSANLSPVVVDFDERESCNGAGSDMLLEGDLGVGILVAFAAEPGELGAKGSLKGSIGCSGNEGR
jgi:hypothetical protein